MWVRSEYAGELAVLSAWVCALLPWSVTYANLEGTRMVRAHFQVLFAQFVFGDVSPSFVTPVGAVSFAANETTALGYELWLVGVATFALAFALSVVYYVHEERLEARSRVDPARLMGALLLTAAVPYTAASYYVLSGHPGVTVPVGVVFMYVLGGLLLVVERT